MKRLMSELCLGVTAFAAIQLGVYEAQAMAAIDVSCAATLTYPSADPSAKPIVIKQDAIENAAQANQLPGFQLAQVPHVLLNFGPYSLVASLEMEGADPSHLQSAFNVELYQGNPVANQVNFSSLTGFDQGQPLNAPLNITGHNFLNFQYQGHAITRVDYTCTLADKTL